MFHRTIYGLETNSPWGIVFKHSDFAPNGVALIPTQLISSGLNFLHFFLLIVFAKRKKIKRERRLVPSKEKESRSNLRLG
ncbi:MAG TPA: prolipoprotein diacylglyceryl transferase [Candidatus Merdenecus merdavium]|nr:prolipoprotein diacylglyceryl transferase [Candidatus Merdenecus merdavium]